MNFLEENHMLFSLNKIGDLIRLISFLLLLNPGLDLAMGLWYENAIKFKLRPKM